MRNNTELSRIFLPLGALSLTAALFLGAGCSTTPAKPDEGAAADLPSGVELLGTVDTTTAYQVGDITLIHKKTPANAVVAARVYMIGGATNLTEENAGIERLALNIAVNGGTKTHPKDEFNALLDSMGASVSSFSDRDFSGYAMQSTVEHFEPTWDLMLETILAPEMPESELELQRRRHLADIKTLKDDPDRLVGYTALKLLFVDHPYDTFQLGTAENVKSFTLAGLSEYQQSMLHPEDMTVVVVGNIPSDELIKKVKKFTAEIPKVAPRPHEALVPYKDISGAIKIEEKAIPTNYIFGLYPAPAPGDEDYEAMLVAVEYLGDRLFEEVRTKRNLTYAVSAGLSDRRVNYGVIYVTAVDPDQTMPVIFDEIQKLKDGDFKAEDLNESRSVFITRHYMALETNGSQASLLARSHLIAGDWTRFATSIDRLQAVTAEDVERVAKKYMHDYRFGVVGQPADINKPLFLTGKLPPGAERPELDGHAPEDQVGSPDEAAEDVEPENTSPGNAPAAD